jgi:hypothetical protein
MGYIKQNFKSGEKLFASQLNAMDNQIALNEEMIGGKQPKIEDIETIRNNAAKGATALQEIPSGYIKDTDLKTINGQSLIGEGDIVIEGGGSQTVKIQGKNLICSWTDGYVVSDVGTVIGDPYPFEVGACSDFVSVEVGTTYILDARGESSPFAILGFFYDESKKATINDKFTKSGTPTIEDKVYKFTAKKPYMRFNKYKDTYGFALIKESDYVKDAPENYVPVDEVIEVEATSNVVYYALGDSITAGSYSDNDGKALWQTMQVGHMVSNSQIGWDVSL